MAADYPAAYVANPQSTTQDVAGDPTIANGADYNSHDEEIAAISADLIAAFGVEGAATITALVTAALGGFTDGAVWLGSTAFFNVEGFAWTTGASAAVTKWIRTPGVQPDSLLCNISAETRAAAAKGYTLTSVDVVWSTEVAVNVVDPSLLIATIDQGGDTVVPGFSVIATTYDTAHDTPTKRKSIKEHTATLTLDTPAKLAISKGHALFFKWDDTGGGTSEVTFYGAMLHFTRADVSGA